MSKIFVGKLAVSTMVVPRYNERPTQVWALLSGPENSVALDLYSAVFDYLNEPGRTPIQRVGFALKGASRPTEVIGAIKYRIHGRGVRDFPAGKVPAVRDLWTIDDTSWLRVFNITSLASPQVTLTFDDVLIPAATDRQVLWD